MQGSSLPTWSDLGANVYSSTKAPVQTFYNLSVTNGWAELTLFGLRLALAFVLSLWGWTITLGALARTTTPADASAVEVPTAEEAPAPVQNAA